MDVKKFKILREMYPTESRNAVVEELLDEIEGLNRMAVMIYNSGYHAGHHDTVEGQYTHIVPNDMDTYQADIVEELIAEYAESEVADK